MLTKYSSKRIETMKSVLNCRWHTRDVWRESLLGRLLLGRRWFGRCRRENYAQVALDADSGILFSLTGLGIVLGWQWRCVRQLRPTDPHDCDVCCSECVGQTLLPTRLVLGSDATTADDSSIIPRVVLTGRLSMLVVEGNWHIVHITVQASRHQHGEAKKSIRKEEKKKKYY